MNVVYKAPARAELYDAFDWYEAISPGLGERFVSEFNKALARIVAFPESGAGFVHGARRTRLAKFPYCIWYRPRGDVLTIYAVAHMHRHPAYWSGRLD